MAITFSCDVSRTSGVAPLTVFIDCTGTTATGVTYPFHELFYEHSFGDSGAGFWQYGAQAGTASKNYATGACAAHVFESPGTYTITSRCWDGSAYAYEQNEITVTDPNTIFSGANTICISSDTLPVAGQNGVPSGATCVVQSNFTTILSTYANTGTGKRIMLKRGDTFTVASRGRVLDDGPGIICAYGTGAKPIINMTSGCTVFITNDKGNTSNYDWGDWRFMDFQVDCNDLSGSHGPGLEDPAGGFVSLLCLRVEVNDCSVGFGFGKESICGTNNSQGRHHVMEQLAIVECKARPTFGGGAASYSAYNAGNRIACLGNDFDNNGTLGGTHVTRWLFLNKAVIAHNNLLRAGYPLDTPARHCIKMHGPQFISGAPSGSTDSGSDYSPDVCGDGYTKYVIISDNYLESAEGENQWMIAIGPQDSANDERLHDIIVERNVAHGNAYTTALVTICAKETTTRNNLMYGSSCNEQYILLARRDGGEPAGTNYWCYNNTLYTNSTATNLELVSIWSSLLSNFIIRNNLGYAPYASNPQMLVDAGATNVTSDHNSTNFTASPSFDGTTNIKDFRLQTGSYAIDDGIATFPATSRDFFGCIDKNPEVRLGAMVPKSYAQGHGAK